MFLWEIRWWLLAGWLVLLNLIAIIVTIHDKKQAQREGWRVRESTLLLIGILGGSPAMLLTMRKIRHKTRHAKFMVGLPVILVLQAALLALAIWKWGF